MGMEWTSDYQKMQKKSPNLNNGKVAVVSAHHALLLHGGLLAQCDFSITRPPSVVDRFVELYTDECVWGRMG